MTSRILRLGIAFAVVVALIGAVGVVSAEMNSNTTNADTGSAQMAEMADHMPGNMTDHMDGNMMEMMQGHMGDHDYGEHHYGDHDHGDHQNHGEHHDGDHEHC